MAVPAGFGSVAVEGAQVLPVRVQDPALGGVLQVVIQNFRYLGAVRSILYGKHYLDPLVEIARHPIGAA